MSSAVQCSPGRERRRTRIHGTIATALHKKELVASMRRPHISELVQGGPCFPGSREGTDLRGLMTSADVVCSNCPPLARRSCTFCESLFPVLAHSLRAQL
jgi:hypothetical protein